LCRGCVLIVSTLCCGRVFTVFPSPNCVFDSVSRFIRADAVDGIGEEVVSRGAAEGGTDYGTSGGGLN
jgi:hypothetical protein